MKSITRFFLLFISSLCFVHVNAQIKVEKLSAVGVPKGLSFKGKILETYKYSDTDGDHLLITTADQKATKEDNASKYLYAYNFLIKGSTSQLYWQLNDLVEDCPVDNTAEYLPGTFAVTDLNKDGKAEVWLMYKTACRGDVSSGTLKLIMHEGTKKYAMRGTTHRVISGQDFGGGDYKFDDAFKNAPAGFTQYAKSLWQKNVIER